MLDQLLKTLQQSDSQYPKRTKKELVEDVQAYMASLFEPEPSATPVVEMLRDGTREVVELLTKRYSLKEAEALPKGSVVLQIDNRLDVMVVTPYIVSGDDKLIDFFKSKHLNHSPIVKASSNSVFVVLHLAQKGLSMKENVIEAKQKLDMLVAVLNMNFKKGSYIAEPVDEVKPDVPKPRKFGIGSAIYEEVLEQSINSPVGTVFKSEGRHAYYDDNDNEIDADVLVIGSNGRFIAMNAEGEKIFVDLDESELLGLGEVVFMVDRVSEDDLAKIMKGNAGTIRVKWKDFHKKYDQYRNELVRRNPRKNPSSPFKRWLYTVSPSFGSIKQHL